MAATGQPPHSHLAVIAVAITTAHDKLRHSFSNRPPMSRHLANPKGNCAGIVSSSWSKLFYWENLTLLQISGLLRSISSFEKSTKVFVFETGWAM